jgi:type II secretion system protein N
VTQQLKERLRAAGRWILYPTFFLFAFLLFLSWTFPYDKLKERLVSTFNAQQRASSSQQELQIDALDSYFVTGVRATGVHLLMPPVEPGKPPVELKLDEARARVSLLSLLVGNKDVTFTLKAFEGQIDGEFIDKGKERIIKVEFDAVDVGKIDMLSQQLGVPMEGKLFGKVDLRLPEGKASKGSGVVNLEIRDLSVGDGKAKIKGLLELPKLTVGALRFEAEAKEGVLKVSKFGAAGKDLELAGDGRIQMRELANDSGLDLAVRFKVNDGYRGKNDKTKSLFGAPGSNIPPLFELDPTVKRAKTPDGFYAFQVKGQLGKPQFLPASGLGGLGSSRGGSP